MDVEIDVVEEPIKPRHSRRNGMIGDGSVNDRTTESENDDAAWDILYVRENNIRVQSGRIAP